MSGYSEDLRRSIASAVEGGTSKAQAARTFSLCEPLFSQALHKQGRAGRASDPQEEARTCSEARREGKEAPCRRPRRTSLRRPPRALRIRRGHHGTLGESLDHVPGNSPHRPHQEKGGRVATERDESERAAWKAMVAEKIDPERSVFVDECGTHTSLAPLYGYAPRGERLRLSVPRERGKNTTVLSSMTLLGMGPSLAVEGATTARVFETYVGKVLVPSLRAGQIVVMDDFLGAHRPKKIRELIEQRGCELVYLPAHSPDYYNPIEEAFAKIKNLLRKAAARTKEALVEAIAAARYPRDHCCGRPGLL
jgi:transposase/transposase-like protein